MIQLFMQAYPDCVVDGEFINDPSDGKPKKLVFQVVQQMICKKKIMLTRREAGKNATYNEMIDDEIDLTKAATDDENEDQKNDNGRKSNADAGKQQVQYLYVVASLVPRPEAQH